MGSNRIPPSPPLSRYYPANTETTPGNSHIPGVFRDVCLPKWTGDRCLSGDCASFLGEFSVGQ